MTEIRAARERLNVLRAARDRVAAVREAREAEQARRAELVASVCRVCGAQVAAGEGTIEPESTLRDPQWKRNHEVVHGWRRQHDACRPDAGAVIRRLTGIEVTESEVAEVLRAMRDLAPYAAGRYDVERGQFPPQTAEPFAWIDRETRDWLREVVEHVRAESRPSQCVDGACGLCGRAESIGWRKSPLTWRDGSPAPLCAPCATWYDRAGQPSDLDSLRRVAVRLWLGERWWQMGVPATESGFRLFCEIATEAEREEGCEPWSYRPAALAVVRETLYRMRPRYASAADRERIEAEQRESDAQERREADDAALAARPWLDPQLWAPGG